MKKKKKYSMGSSVKNYIETPQSALQQHEIDLAKSKHEAETNPWVVGLNLAGNAAMQYGLSQGGFGSSGLGQAANTLLPMLSNMEFAFGGGVPNIPVEIEGQEVGETPKGELFEAKGPSHENGGIDVSLPEGTEMYSKRIKIDNVSMADRKKKRKKKEMTLESLLEDNQNDAIYKSTLKRVKEVNEKEEELDTNLQDFISSVLDKKTKDENHLNNINEKQLFQAGGTIKGGLSGTENYLLGLTNLLDYTSNPMEAFATPGINSSLPSTKTPSLLDSTATNDYITSLLNLDNQADNFSFTPLKNSTQPDYSKFTTVPTDDLNTKSLSTVPVENFDNLDVSGLSTVPLDENSVPYESKDLMTMLKSLNMGEGNGAGPTFGDSIGLVGNLVSSYLPYFNTLKNRAEDTPNVNSFENYGEDGLIALDKARQYVESQRDKNLQDLNLARNSSIKRNRNSVRGINNLRALDLAVDQASNKQQTNIYDTFSKQMMTLATKQADLENQQDKIVMTGEYNRDLADRQDMDNFFTQLAQNYVGMGTGLQETGKDLNAIKRDDVQMELINQMSKYGITVDKNGKLKTKK